MQVGIGDLHCVVFHLPGSSSNFHACRPINHELVSEINSQMDACVSDDLLIAVLKLLKKYLMDDSVNIVDITSQTLRVGFGVAFGFEALLKSMKVN